MEEVRGMFEHFWSYRIEGLAYLALRAVTQSNRNTHTHTERERDFKMSRLNNQNSAGPYVAH